jgi:hypothetical protein
MERITRAPMIRVVRRYFALLISLVALAVGIGGATGASATPTTVAKTCSTGYRHAVIGGAEKCLRAGEFCTHSYDRQYQRYGYRCIRFYANVQRYRLTHA